MQRFDFLKITKVLLFLPYNFIVGCSEKNNHITNFTTQVALNTIVSLMILQLVRSVFDHPVEGY